MLILICCLCGIKHLKLDIFLACPTFSVSYKRYKDTFKEEMVLLAATAINQRRQVARRDHLEALDSSVYIQLSYRQCTEV